MENVNVFSASPGMILVRDVVNRDGRRLFDRGTALTQKQIRILKMWGIHEIMVAPHSPPADPGTAAPGTAGGGNSAEVARFLERHFQDNDLSDPVVREVIQQCRRRFEADGELFAGSLEEHKDRDKPVRPGNKTAGPPESIDLDALLKTDLKLPSLPTIFFEISSASKNPRFSGKDIADIVSKDPSLSATLLRIINSAFYGFQEPVESLAYAAMALGSRQVCSLALGVTVINYFKGMPSGIINMESFWRHSLACGITAQALASHVSDVDGDRLFIGGLLHDIGKLVFYSAFPQTSVTAFAQAGRLGLMLYQVEPKYFGMTHARFGAKLAEKWKFSPEIAALIHFHHDNFRETPSKEAAVVHFSNWLVNALTIGSAGDTALPRLNTRAWDTLEVSPGVLAHVVRQVDRQTREAIRFFYA